MRTALHLFSALIKTDTRFLQPYFNKHKINTSQVLDKIEHYRYATANSTEPETLLRYGKNLTKLALAGKLDPVIGRDDVIKRVIQILCRRTKNNPIILGEPGVGKTALAEGIAQRIITSEVPDMLKGLHSYT